MLKVSKSYNTGYNLAVKVAILSQELHLKSSLENS